MRIATWNIGGFGAEGKKSIIKSLIKEEMLDLLGLVETKHIEVTEWDMRKCWGHSGSDHMHVTAVQGSGGILIAWHQEAFKLQNSFAMGRWLCVEGEFIKSRVKCAVCLVYAPNDHHERLIVWNQIRCIRPIIEVPLILMGDFNKVLSPHERRGGNEVSQGMRELNNFFHDLHLVDMELDQQFTWLRKNAASRIDKILIEKEVILAFPNYKAYCRDRMFSNHFPLVFTSVLKGNPTPFRTLDCWLDEPSFEEVFRKEWLQLGGKSLVSKLKLIKKPLKAWNKGVFGLIDSKLCLFQEAIRKLDKEAQSRSLDECEWIRLDALRAQLWHWMIRKERYWRQLLRCKVIKEGDRNTKYFHLKATMRRQRNTINKLIINGEEVVDIRVINSHILSYFKMFYKKQKSVCFDLSTLGLPKLPQEDAEMLETPVTRLEVKEALFSYDPSKACLLYTSDAADE